MNFHPGNFFPQTPIPSPLLRRGQRRLSFIFPSVKGEGSQKSGPMAHCRGEAELIAGRAPLVPTSLCKNLGVMSTYSCLAMPQTGIFLRNHQGFLSTESPLDRFTHQERKVDRNPPWRTRGGRSKMKGQLGRSHREAKKNEKNRNYFVGRVVCLGGCPAGRSRAWTRGGFSSRPRAWGFCLFRPSFTRRRRRLSMNLITHPLPPPSTAVMTIRRPRGSGCQGSGQSVGMATTGRGKGFGFQDTGDIIRTHKGAPVKLPNMRTYGRNREGFSDNKSQVARRYFRS